MNRTFFCLSATWLLAAAPLCAQGPAVGAAPAPIIFCAQPNFDFGSSESGRSVSHEYVIQNKGDALLSISEIRPSCGCTVASISTQAVAPGAEARVTAVLNLAGRSGPQHKTIAVDSNDPKQPQPLDIEQFTRDD